MFYKGICGMWPLLVARRDSDRPVLLVLRAGEAGSSLKSWGRTRQSGYGRGQCLPRCPALTAAHALAGPPWAAPSSCTACATQTPVNLKTECVPGWFVLLLRGTQLWACIPTHHEGGPQRASVPWLWTFLFSFVKSFFTSQSLHRSPF